MIQQLTKPKTDLAARYIRLRDDLEHAEALVAEVKAKLAALEEEIIDAWAEEGKNCEHRDEATIYFDRRLRVSVPQQRQSMAAAMCERLGWQECVRTSKWVDENRLAARVRAVIGDEFDETRIPLGLRRVASVFVQTGVRLRRKEGGGQAEPS